MAFKLHVQDHRPLSARSYIFQRKRQWTYLLNDYAIFVKAKSLCLDIRSALVVTLLWSRQNGRCGPLLHGMSTFAQMGLSDNYHRTLSLNPGCLFLPTVAGSGLEWHGRRRQCWGHETPKVLTNQEAAIGPGWSRRRGISPLSPLNSTSLVGGKTCAASAVSYRLC